MRIAHGTLHSLLVTCQSNRPAPAKPGMVIEERCLKLAGLAASFRVNVRCCSTEPAMSPSCICGVVRRGPRTLPAVLGVAAPVSMSIVAAGCWSPHGDVNEAVKDAEGLRLTVLLQVRTANLA
jgi:hypothetical protein